ncbi:uncharacterized protein [Macrobrachium rosenbergii]|uniref:uncharacterized protein n=1 Tax=Macrobrachium rosenbergii TaxID=79674 RepID=UPI0034D65339
MMGHTIQVTSKDLFPFIEYQLNSPEPGTTVTPLDSLDVRMLNITAKMLNFTQVFADDNVSFTAMYVMRKPSDDEWGSYSNGKWSGMVYRLEQNIADISTMLFWSYERKQAIDFTRIYANEPYVMVTRKPKPAPQHLALIRPFSGEEMFLGWWMMFTMLVLTVYKSSLTAHLSVPVTPPPIDTIQQLLKVEGATWGMEPGYGLGWEYFKNNDNPDVRGMFKELLVLETDEQMRRVLDGYHALFTWKYYIKTIIASNFTAALGFTPIHISREEFIPGPTGWGVRKGAPFLNSLDRIQDRLIEAGIVDYWLRELFDTAVWKRRMIRKNKILAGEEEERTYLQV